MQWPPCTSLVSLASTVGSGKIGKAGLAIRCGKYVPSFLIDVEMASSTNLPYAYVGSGKTSSVRVRHFGAEKLCQASFVVDVETAFSIKFQAPSSFGFPLLCWELVLGIFCEAVTVFGNGQWARVMAQRNLCPNGS